VNATVLQEELPSCRQDFVAKLVVGDNAKQLADGEVACMEPRLRQRGEVGGGGGGREGAVPKGHVLIAAKRRQQQLLQCGRVGFQQKEAVVHAVVHTGVLRATHEPSSAGANLRCAKL
jgi:hypothetical protein